MPNQRSFHDTYLNKINTLAAEFRLPEAIREYQKYIQTYPRDVLGYIYYADALFKNNNLDEIEPILQKAEKLVSKKVNYKDVLFIQAIRLKLLVALNKYQEAYNYFMENEKDFYDIKSISMYKSFLEKKMGKLITDVSDTTYLKKQILLYQDETTLSHIKKQHLQEFADSFSLEAIYYELKKSLPNELKIRSGFLADCYIFKSLACGYDKGRLVDFLKVVTFSNSDEIITMFPYSNRERLDFIDLNNTLEGPKLKRMNQIEKFNKKYNQGLNK